MDYGSAMTQVETILDDVETAGDLSDEQESALLDIIGDDESFETEEARNSVYALGDRLRDGEDAYEAVNDTVGYIQDALKEKQR